MEMYIKRNGKIAVTDGRRTLVKALRAGHATYGDIQFLIAASRSSVRLEKNITAAEILIALEPWADYLGTMASIDLSAWIKAAEKTKPLVTSKFSHIEIGANISFESLYKGEVGIKHPPRKRSNKIEISQHWSAFGVRRQPVVVEAGQKPVHHMELSLTPFFQWARLPVKISEAISVSEFIHEGDFKARGALFNHANTVLKKPLRHDVEGTKSAAWTSSFRAVCREAPRFYDVIIRAFLGDLLAHRHPDDIREARKKVLNGTRNLEKRATKRA